VSQTPEQDQAVAVQREVARIALAGVDGFALAGSGAIREHGMIDRPTEDVDLFTTSQDVTAFGTAVDQVTAELRGSGYQVDQTRRAPQFARLHVATRAGVELDVDLGVDWRQDDPVALDVGPVLSLADAVGNKVGALYSRGEVRDYLDVDAIRASGRFSDDQLIAAATARDAGFEVDMFVWRLDAARRIDLDDVTRYDVTADQLESIKARCTEWASDLRDRPGNRSESQSTEELHGLTERMRAGFPTPATEASRPRSEPPTRPAQQQRPPDQERGFEL
jgi:Nucleotidyl transferase AbiEii toxin, Type IV TA system